MRETESYPWEWAVRRLLPDLLEDLGRIGWRLILTDVAVRVLSLALAVPVIAFVLDWFLRRAGVGVVADYSIVFFFLSPAGLATILVVGSLAGATYFAETSALVVIPAGRMMGYSLWPRGAIRVVVRAFPGLVEVAARAIVRLTFILAAPVAISAAVYAWLLTEHDIYFYLTSRPREFWIAAAMIAVALGVGAALALTRLLRWAFAIPILLFEGSSPRRSLSESDRRTSGRLTPLVAWHLAWLLASIALSGISTFLTGAIARLLIPLDSGLAVVALGAAVTAGLGVLIQLATAAASIAVYAVLLVRLYWPIRALDPPVATPRRLAALDGVRWNVGRTRIAWGIGIAATVGLVSLAGSLVNRIGIDPAAEVTAHRGAKHEAPENTLPAIARAIELGADWVEIDVQLTADDRVIVVHDRDFIRVAGSSIRAEEADLADLVRLDVGGWFDPTFAGTPPPTLEEVLQACRGRIGVTIELKYFGPDRGLARRVIELVDRYGMAEQVMLMSFDHRRMAEAAAGRPDLEIGLLLAATLGDALRLEADFYAVPPELATHGFVRGAHRLGRDVHVWTVDDPVRVSAMLSRGVDNIYTGATSTVRRVLAERAALGPIERLLIDIAAELGVVELPPPAPARREDA